MKDSDLLKKSKGKKTMADEKPVSTSTNVEEKTVKNADVSAGRHFNLLFSIHAIK